MFYGKIVIRWRQKAKLWENDVLCTFEVPKECLGAIATKLTVDDWGYKKGMSSKQ